MLEKSAFIVAYAFPLQCFQGIVLRPVRDDNGMTVLLQCPGIVQAQPSGAAGNQDRGTGDFCHRGSYRYRSMCGGVECITAFRDDIQTVSVGNQGGSDHVMAWHLTMPDRPVLRGESS